MRAEVAILTAILLSSALMCGCGGAGVATFGGVGNPPAAPTVSTTAAENGAVIVSLASTTAGAVIYCTVDGSTPSPSSQQYQAPFLVASNLTVKAIAVSGASRALTVSMVTSQSFSPNIPSGTLVWSDEFTNTTGAIAQPNPAVWAYDTGNSGFGNGELENYCAWGSSTSPCSTANPSEYVGTDGYLHIEAQQPSAGVYTSARLKTQGLFSFQYGRFEVRALVPEAQGFWPGGMADGQQYRHRELAGLRRTGRAGARQRGRYPGLEFGLHSRDGLHRRVTGNPLLLSQRAYGGRVAYLRNDLVAGQRGILRR